MKSMTSCFNNTIFKKDLRLFWPLEVIAFLLMQIVVVFPLLARSTNLEHAYSGLEQMRYYMIWNFCDISNQWYIVAFAAGFSLVAALLVFQYLNRQQAAFMIHSMPLCRKTLFVTHFLSGLLLAAVPMLILVAELALVSAVSGIHLGLLVLSFGIEILVMVLFFYSTAVLLIMMSGNMIISSLMYVVLNVLVYGFDMLLNGYAVLFVYGKADYSMYPGKMETFLNKILSFLSPPLKFYSILHRQRMYSGEEENYYDMVNLNNLPVDVFQWQNVLETAVYLIPATVFILLAFILYKKRKMERVGDLLVFNFTKVVYRTVFCVCGSLIVAYALCQVVEILFAGQMIYGVYYYIGILFLGSGVVFCYVICDMILEKTVRIRGKISFFQMGIITVAMAALLVGFKANTEKNESVEEGKVQRLEIIDDFNTYVIDDEETIKEFTALERQIVADGKNQSLQSQYDGYYINFNYQMNDEMEIWHRYILSANADDPHVRIITSMLNDLDLKDALIPDNAGYENVKYIEYLYKGENFDEEGYKLTDATDEELYNAVLRDLEEGNIYARDGLGETEHSSIMSEKEVIGCIRLEYYDVMTDETDVEEYRHVYLVITEDSVNTVKELERMDMINRQ